MREVIKAVKDRQYNDKKKNDRIINIDSPSVARGLRYFSTQES